MTSVIAVTRTYQAGATFATYDREKFQKGVVAPILKLLDTAPPCLKGIVVVSCGEAGSKYAEEMRDGDTVTSALIRQEFADEVANGIVHPVVTTNWGLNGGSGTALNDGVEVARSLGAGRVLLWSKEIDLSGHMLSEMIEHMDRYDLPLVGYARMRWFQRLAWTFAQNTCALWDMNTLARTQGFDPICNGDGKTTVKTEEFGDVPLAGMEDYHTYLRASKLHGAFLRWGVVGQRHPAIWDTSMKKPGSPEYIANAKKVARQGLVMEEYGRMIFPQMEPVEVYDELMARLVIA